MVRKKKKYNSFYLPRTLYGVHVTMNASKMADNVFAALRSDFGWNVARTRVNAADDDNNAGVIVVDVCDVVVDCWCCNPVDDDDVGEFSINE